MGGSSSGQVTGYKYLTNFLLFIGNPIEKLLNINFDKRGWIANERISYGSNGEMIYIENINLYGENEGGVAGTMRVKHGTNNQTASTQYKKYMASLGLPASAYPYQSYIMFGGGGFPQGSWDLTEEELETIGDELEENDKYYNRGAFYVGNSGYMKEMLLWPKRTRIRNDGRRQWYEVRGDGAVVCEIGEYKQVKAPQSRSNTSAGSLNLEHRRHTKHNNSTVQSSPEKLDYWPDHNMEWHFSDAVSYGLFVVSPGSSDSLEIIENVIIERESLPICIFEVTFTSTGDMTYTVSGDILEMLIISDETHEWTANTDPSRTKVIKVVARLSTELQITQQLTNPETRLGNLVLASGVKIKLIGFVDEHWSLNPSAPDINPVHKIREILTDDTAMNKPEASVNDDNFIKAADRIWGEGLGVSWSITEKSCMDAINELCYHIEAGIRVNRQTGLYEMVLFRDDWFEESEIHTIAESKIKSMQYEITNADEVVNHVNVNFYDRANIKNSSFSISENGLIQTLGRVNAETLDFPYFMNIRNAEIVANWKLKQLSTGAFKGSFTTGWREARKWNRYDLIRLPWSKRWNRTILVRIMSINLGGPTNNEVTIEFIEVVPATAMMNTTIVIDDPIDKPLPPQACQYEPFELPYYLGVMLLGQRQVDDELAYESNFGLVGAVAEQPQSNSLYAIMKTHNGVEGEEWLRAASIHYSETADFDQIISKTSTSFTVKNWKKIVNVPAGTLIKCGRDWLGTPGEWMVFQGVDVYTGIVSVKRGALDTPPQEWGPGSKLYFCGTDIAFDETEYVSGENVLVSALTTTPSGVLEQRGSIPIEMKARAVRPYPPANVKFNDVYFPETHIVTNNIALTWSHRNRVQQTGGEILGWYDGDVTMEGGVTYSYELISENVILDSQSNVTANTVTILSSVLIPNKPHTLKLWSVRDGYESYQKFEHSFFAESASLILTATTTGSGVAGNTVSVANISVNIDESLKANMKFDGSSISGKALVGSTITIEIQE